MSQDPFTFAKSFLPTSVGFDGMLQNLESMHRALAKSVPGYPPYNIKKVEENKYVIELAVAGFGKHDIDVELNEGVLSIKGNTTLDTLTRDGVNATYLHKGIADRAFTRNFTLADSVEIKNAELINGMLKIWLEAIIPDSKKPKKININEPSDTKGKSAESTKQFIAEYQK